MKEFFKKILKGLIEHWVISLLSAIAVFLVGQLLWVYRTYVNGWLFTTHSLGICGLLWLLLFCIFLFLLTYFLISFLHDRGCLKDPIDIKSAIEDWLNGDDRDPYYNKEGSVLYTGLEKFLNIKRGSLKKYLPELAPKSGYSVEMGKKTFRLTGNPNMDKFRDILKKI